MGFCRVEVFAVILACTLMFVFGFAIMQMHTFQQHAGEIQMLHQRITAIETALSANGHSLLSEIQSSAKKVALLKSKDHIRAASGSSGSKLAASLALQDSPNSAPVIRQTCAANVIEADAKRMAVATVRAPNTWSPAKSTFPMAVHAIPDFVSSHISAHGQWEPWICAQMIAVFNPQFLTTHSLTLPSVEESDHSNDHFPVDFIDIGANVGFFTLFAANLGLNVMAVEPFGLNTPLILRSMCVHNKEFSDRIHLHKVALTDVVGGDMCLWSTNTQVNNGNARLTPYFEGTKDFDQDKGKRCMERIRSSTLDRLLFEDPTGPQLAKRPRALKIDIEGFETLVMRGAKKLLSSEFAPCYMFFEYQKVPTVTSGAGDREIFDILLSAGYKLYLHVGNNVLKPVQGPLFGECSEMCDYSAYLVTHEKKCGPSALDSFLPK